MSGAATPSTLTTTTSSTLTNHPHRGRRLRNFLLPSGREIHIALSPEEASSLRHRLSTISPNTPFDLVIHGSPEHIEALRQAHSHHENRREELKKKHGEGVYGEFENVKEELDTLAGELRELSEGSVSLDANFSKFGYSAHLRTYDEGGSASGTVSGASSVRGWDGDKKKNWEKERRNGRVMKIYKKPTVRQYFHKGLLWRASETTEVASFELFVDLLYVGILAINGDRVAEDPTGDELLRFSITMIMSWKIWSDLALIISWFETDDILQRLSVMFVMACLLGLTTNMLEAMGETYTMLVSFYLAARLFMATYYFILSFVVPMVRYTMLSHVLLVLIPSSLWLASIHVSYPTRLSLIWIAIIIDLWGSSVLVGIVRGAKRFPSKLKSWAERAFEFYPGVNIEHKTERTNAFVSLVFGYSVVAIIYQSTAARGVNAFYGKAVLGLIQAFAFNWIYFELDGSDLYAHAIRRSVFTAIMWAAFHLPFIMSYVLGAAALSKLVLATDCPDANVDDLTELYALKSEPEIPMGLRWFYCAGLGIALACMGIISICHDHKDSSTHVIRLSKKFRMLNRFSVCIILICLPLAHSLNSLKLISITTGLVVWVLLLELWGMSCPDETFFGGGKKCRYTAKCKVRKGDLEKMKQGVVGVEELGERGDGEKGMWEIS